MRKQYINYDDAKALVKKQRSCIYPNDGFVRQLQAYWKLLVKREEERLRLLEEMNRKKDGKEEEGKK